MRYSRLPTKEWEKRQRQSRIKLQKIKTEILNYMDKHHIDGTRCKKCNVRVILGARTKDALRVRCPKCKKARIIKIALPKRFVPTYPVKKLKKYF